MSDAQTTDIAEHTPAKPLPMPAPAPSKRDASRPGRVTGKLVVALKRIIELGEELDEAAKEAGLTTHAVRLALQRPHVIQWMKAQREVFRAYVCAQNIHHAKDLRDNGRNETARVQAMRFIEQLSDEPQAQSGGVRSPGFVIVVNAGAQPAGSAKPLIELHSEPREDA